MSIILKENEWAHNMITECDLGKKPSETIRRVARYYIDQGYSEKETRDKLDEFMLRCDPTVSLPKWSDMLDYALRKAKKYKAVNIDFIPISETEMSTIDKIDTVQGRRLAFTLLCLSKYWNIVNPEMRSWVINEDSEIMKLANISTSLKRQGLLYNKLNTVGLVSFSHKINNTNVKVEFGDDNKTVLKVNDFRNLGYQYLMYHGEPYFVCENCGIVTKRINNPKNTSQKYCRECAQKVKTRQNVESIMRCKARRQAQKQISESHQPA